MKRIEIGVPVPKAGWVVVVSYHRESGLGVSVE